MNLAEITAEVYTITGREDLVAETLTAIKAATLKAHNSDFYLKDLQETGIVFQSESYTQQLDYRTLFPLWRKIKYLRKYDEISGVAGDFLDIILPDEVLDGWKVTRDNVAYESGAVINIRSSTLGKYYLLGYYANPNITEAAYNSWVALDHPFFIIFSAAAQVFKMIGKTEDSNTYQQLVAEQFAELKIAEIASVGS